jgi:hypothetical protein
VSHGCSSWIGPFYSGPRRHHACAGISLGPSLIPFCLGAKISTLFSSLQVRQVPMDGLRIDATNAYQCKFQAMAFSDMRSSGRCHRRSFSNKNNYDGSSVPQFFKFVRILQGTEASERDLLQIFTPTKVSKFLSEDTAGKLAFFTSTPQHHFPAACTSSQALPRKSWANDQAFCLCCCARVGGHISHTVARVNIGPS